MNKITPKDVFSNTIKYGNFTINEQSRHPITGKYNKLFRVIDTKLFGTTFIKCIGDLNSVVKRGVSNPETFQKIVKKKIGYRMCSKTGSNKPTGNARYANTDEIFRVLHREHIELVCKRHKREMVKDFYELKERFIMKFHNMKGVEMGHVEDFITISDAFNVGYKLPTVGNLYHDCGYILLNTRAVSKDNVFIAVEDHNDLFGNYEDSVLKSRELYYNTPIYDSLVFTVFVRELVNGNDDLSESTYCNIPLFKYLGSFDQSLYSNNKIKCFNTSFDGIDINGMAKALSDEFDAFYDEFNAGIEALKMKYHGEYLLSEICDSEHGAI